MTFVAVPVGNVASGKTTLLRSEAKRRGAFYLSPDDIRQELCGNALDQSQNNRVWQVTYSRLSTALAKKQSVVLDATNTNRLLRQQLFHFCRIHGATEIELWWFCTPLALCLRRNERRDRHVPEYVLERMHKQMLEPFNLADEPYDRIILANVRARC